MSEIIDGIKRVLLSRKQAYERTFDSKNADSMIVMKDLARFCRADKSTFHEDPRVAANLDGRREVWLRIQQYLNLSSDELWEITRKD